MQDSQGAKRNRITYWEGEKKLVKAMAGLA
jgi:hypothetical protein